MPVADSSVTAEMAAPPPVPASRRPRRKARQQFSLLIVRGDGSRLVRFNFPRPAAMAAFAAVAVAASVCRALFGGWERLRKPTVEARPFTQHSADHPAPIHSSQRGALAP